MFVKEDTYNKVVAENGQLQEEVQKLTSQIDTFKVQAEEFLALTEKLTALETEKANSLLDINTANKNTEEAMERITVLEKENTELNVQVEKLSALPGSKPATAVSKTENTNSGTNSELESVNELCKSTDDINARMAAVKKLGI